MGKKTAGQILFDIHQSKQPKGNMVVQQFPQYSEITIKEAMEAYAKQETERLQSENEMMRELLKEIELDYSKEANEYHMMNLPEQSKFWSDKANEINNILNPK